MIKRMKKPVSILLSILMIVSLFTIIPVVTAGAVDTYWYEVSLDEIQNGDEVIVTMAYNNALTTAYGIRNAYDTSTSPLAISFTVDGTTLTKAANGSDDDFTNSKWTVGRSGNNLTFSNSVGNKLFCFNNNTGLRVGGGTNYTFTVDNGYLKNTGRSRYIGVVEHEGHKEWRSYQAISNDISHQTLQFWKEAEVEHELFYKHSITLEGDIGVNYYLDVKGAGITNDDIISGDKELTVSFAWESGSTTLSDVTACDVTIDKDNYTDYLQTANDLMPGTFKVSCNVCAAEMTCGILATATVSGDNTEYTDRYSVRKYCETLFTVNPDPIGDSYADLVVLVERMLDYGAKAQLAFNVNTDDLANDYEGKTYVMPEKTDTEMIALVSTAIEEANNHAAADNMTEVATALGAEYYTSSLIFLSKSTLRHYFTGSNLNANQFTGVKADYYYYIDAANIPAAQLDALQTFSVGGVEFSYSALDYVNAVLNSGNMTDAQKDLARATYWYNQAANAYFG